MRGKASVLVSTLFFLLAAGAAQAQATQTGATASGPAQNPESAVIGRYSWIPSYEAARIYLKHHAKPPVKTLVLSANGLFEHTRSDDLGVETVLGSYVVEKDGIRLVIESGKSADLPLKLKCEAKRLTAPGAVYIRLALKKVVVQDPPPPPPVMTSDIEGIWTLRSNGKENKGIQLIFAGNTFKYVDYGAAEDPFAKISGAVGSSGTFSYDDESGTIELTYKIVDGKVLSEETHMHRKCNLVEEKTAIIIDNFRFERKTSE